MPYNPTEDSSVTKNKNISLQEPNFPYSRFFVPNFIPGSSKGCVSWMIRGASIYIYTPSLRVQTAPELEDAGRSFSGWWFQIFFIFTPIPGEMIQFDLRIFFRWVGEKTTNQFLVSPRKRFHPFNISLTSTPPPSTDGTLKKSVESAAQLTNWNQKRSF